MIRRLLSAYRTWREDRAEAERRRRFREDFKIMVRAHDDAIAFARAHHRPVNSLIIAKRKFVHDALRGGLA